ncbi:MAG TPA: hypothetical protein DCW52_02145 [Gammaproteobacteria bacterium]|jgi:hypothetical protein|nr:hypothetical protein [Gammaproteobacteria bacterium]
MAITYPLALPSHTGIAAIELRAVNAVAYSQSPFTFAGQAHAYSGEMWQADITLPPMKRADAEQWIAFLISLRGQYGTFYLGDPTAAAPRGTVTANNDVNSATGSAGARTISVTISSGETLLAGDYIQIGTTANRSLHKVLVNATGTGAAQDIEIWPALREAKSSAGVNILNTTGKFRLASNQQNWSVNEASIYGLTFGAFEAI